MVRWFRRAVLIGVGANLVLAIPTLIRPEAAVAMLGVARPMPMVWLRFSAMLLILLSCFYIPAGLDPVRYRASAWFAILSRLAGAIFFFLQPTEYRLLALFDWTFLVPQAVLFALMRRAGPT